MTGNKSKESEQLRPEQTSRLELFIYSCIWSVKFYAQSAMCSRIRTKQ